MRIKHEDRSEYGILEKAARSPEGFFAAFLAITEVMFSLFKYGFDFTFIGNKVFFAAILGFLLGNVASLINEKIVRVISIILSFLFMIYLLIQLIYSSVFKNYWSFSATGNMADQIFGFKRTIIATIGREIVPFILIIILYAIIILGCLFWVDFSMHSWEMYLLNVFILGAGILYFVIVLSLQGDDKNSPKNLMSTYSSIEMSVQKLGILETMFRDDIYLFFEKNNTVTGGTDTRFDIELPEEEFKSSDSSDDSLDMAEDENKIESDITSSNSDTDKVDKDIADTESHMYEPHKLDINLSDIKNITSSSSVLELTDYINSVQPTYKNEYTGMFKGYNLIFITAEGFDGYVIDRGLTPELYKMRQNGFKFMNFYTPLWYGSTLGGEYANMTGLMPKSSGYLSMEKVGEQGNALPFCLGNELKNEGYQVFAYHNNEYDYYDRDISRPFLGYDDYMGIGNGLEYESDDYGNYIWPQSDLFMEQNTFSLFSDKEPFHVYYMTVSGHLEYDFNGNAMCDRNYSKVKDLPYSEKTKAYIACQLEFEYMLEALNRDLQDKGIADKTLIVICGDHVPYNDMEIVDELAGGQLDYFDRYRNSLIIYSSSMEKPVKVDKACSSIDILPTVLNLMGIEYDSRMLAGRDILSDEDALVIMHDGSFVTDNYRYNANTGDISHNGNYEVSSTELATKRALVANRFRMADAICELDYYRYIEELLKEK